MIPRSGVPSTARLDQSKALAPEQHLINGDRLAPPHYPRLSQRPSPYSIYNDRASNVFLSPDPRIHGSLSAQNQLNFYPNKTGAPADWASPGSRRTSSQVKRSCMLSVSLGKGVIGTNGVETVNSKRKSPAGRQRRRKLPISNQRAATSTGSNQQQGNSSKESSR